MKDISVGSAWVPRNLTISESTLASIFVMSLPDGVAVRFTEYKRADTGVRAWMRRWFEKQREKYARSRPGELMEPTAMISLIVERAVPDESYALVEARVSSEGAVPEDWPEVTYAELLARAIAFLS